MSGDERIRLKINLHSREFEIESSEEFLRSHETWAARLVEQLLAPHAATALPREASPRADDEVTLRMESAPFGEALSLLPRGTSDVDKVLVAALFAQRANPAGVFTTRDASRALVEQSENITNPSQCVKQNVKTKRVFRHQGAYRLSRDGEARVAELLGQPEDLSTGVDGG
jgi:hypothetical protein